MLDQQDAHALGLEFPQQFGQRLQAGGELSAQPASRVRSARALEHRAGVVGRQLEQRRGALETFAPVGELRLELPALQRLALPRREVPVLDGELVEDGRAPFHRSGIELGQVVLQDAHRPAVRDAVMQRQDQEVLVVGDAGHGRAEERAGAEVERSREVCGGDVARGPLRVGIRGDVGDDEPHRLAGRDALIDRIVGLEERRPQDLVALDEGAERTLERGDVQRTREPRHKRHRVRGAGGLEAVDQPQPLLPGRGREDQWFPLLLDVDDVHVLVPRSFRGRIPRSVRRPSHASLEVPHDAIIGMHGIADD